MLKVKLPHRNRADNMKVKVDDGAEANILPLDSFRSMFPHALDENGYPIRGFLKGSRMTLQCYDDGMLTNHGMIKLKLQHYSDNSFQDHLFYVVETKTCKEIIIGHPASIRLGLIRVLCENIAKSISAIETIPKNSFQDHRLNIDGKASCRKQRSKSESYRETTTRCDTPQNNTGTSHDSDTLTKPQHSQSSTSFRTLTDRVNRSNPKYMVPMNEASLVISDPGTVKTAAHVKEQPLTGPPPKGSRFNPIYIEPGSTSIESTRDLQALYPNSFNCIGDMAGEYDIKTDPTVLLVQHGRCKVPIEYKAEIEKELAEMV